MAEEWTDGEIAAVDWLLEVRRLQAEDGLTVEQAIEQANRTHGEGDA